MMAIEKMDLDGFNYAKIDTDRANQIIAELRDGQLIAGTFEVLERGSKPDVFHFADPVMLHIGTRGEHPDHGDTYVFAGPESHLFTSDVRFL